MVLNLCGTDWDVKEGFIEEDGRVDFNSQTIIINQDLHPHRKRLALTHELLHVIFDSNGIDDCEGLVAMLEHRVLELINVFPEEYK